MPELKWKAVHPTAPNSYIGFEMNPDMMSVVVQGTSIVFSGALFNATQAVKSISVRHMNHAVETGFTEQYVNVNIRSGSSGAFTIVYQIPENAVPAGEYYRNFTFKFTVYTGEDKTGSGIDYVVENWSTHYVPVKCFALSPRIESLSIARYKKVTYGGVERYEKANDGQYAVIEGIKVAAHEGTDPAWFTTCQLSWTSSTKETGSVTLSPASLFAGYSETVPTAFPEMFMEISKSYTFTLRLMARFEGATRQAQIARAFANLHLSGALNGGVAFGKFSESTDDEPLLESAYPIVPLAGLQQTAGASESINLSLGSEFGGFVEAIRYGNVVTVCGSPTTASAIAGGTTERVIAVIPEALRPDVEIRQWGYFGPHNIGLLRFQPLGNIVLSHVQSTTNGAWANLAADYTFYISATWVLK